MIFPSILFWVWMAMTSCTGGWWQAQGDYLVCMKGDYLHQIVTPLKAKCRPPDYSDCPTCLVYRWPICDEWEWTVEQQAIAANGDSPPNDPNLFWVWMAAQQPSCHTISQTDRSIHSGCGNFESKSWTQTSPEHVIEIKTKRRVNKKCWEDARKFCDAVGCPPISSDGCERVTREVWIDGKRWGVLKEGK